MIEGPLRQERNDRVKIQTSATLYPAGPGTIDTYVAVNGSGALFDSCTLFVLPASH